MAADNLETFAERFNSEGGPVPEATADYLKKMWKGLRYAPANFGDKSKTFGLGALQLHPSDIGEPSRDAFDVLLLRLGLVQSLFQRTVLRDYLIDGELSDEVFRAAASIPCDKDELAEAMIHASWGLFPSQAVSEFKEKLVSEGYDPNTPRMDSKFLAWLRDR